MKILITLALIFALGVGFVLGVGTTVYTGIAVAENTEREATIPTRTADLDPLVIEDKVNDFREAYGLNRLERSSLLCEYANGRVPELRTKWDHQSDDEFKKDRLNMELYLLSENLVKGVLTEQHALETWVTSPSHLAGILEPEATKTCVVTYDKTYAIQVFSN